MRQDRRSPEAEAYRKLYKTARWQRIRAAQLAKHPICARCKAKGYVTTATVCHHTDPETKKTAFFDGPFQSVCAPCHDGQIQSEEKTGFSREVGIDGWPTDDRHPSNRVDGTKP
jgi:5-methylcytosine-specific restriction endonuclease McrA